MQQPDRRRAQTKPVRDEREIAARGDQAQRHHLLHHESDKHQACRHETRRVQEVHPVPLASSLGVDANWSAVPGEGYDVRRLRDAGGDFGDWQRR